VYIPGEGKVTQKRPYASSRAWIIVTIEITQALLSLLLIEVKSSAPEIGLINVKSMLSF